MSDTIKRSKAFRTWAERIDSGVFNKAQCNQFAQAIVRRSMGLAPGGRNTTITDDEAQDLVELFADLDDGVSLTSEHAKQGEEWLRRYGTKVLGIPAEAVELFHHFTFHGEARTFGYRGAVPVWRVHLTDGRQLDYYNTAWVTGAYNDSGDEHGWWWS